MKENKLARDFNAKTLTLFALPTMIMMLFESLYTIVDGIFVARLVGIDALSSISIVTPAILFFMGLGTMFGIGGSAIISKKLGEKKDDEARADFTMIALLLVTISVVNTIIGLYFSDELLARLGATDILMPYAKPYFEIFLLGLLIFIGQFLFQSFFVVAGEPKMGLIAVVSAGVTNIVLDYVFIAWCGMGISGAAYATIIGSSIPNIIGIVFFLQKRRALHFVAPKAHFKILWQSCVNGSSAMVNFLAGGVMIAIFNHTMLSLMGEEGVAAMTILFMCEYILNSLLLGYCAGASPVIAFNYGAKNEVSIKRLFRVSFGATMFLSFFALAMLFIFGSNIVGIYIQDNAALHQVALFGLFIFALKYIFAGFNIFAAVIFTSFSNGKLATVISGSKVGLMMIMVLTLPIVFGVKGVWFSISLAELVTFFLSFYLLFISRKRYYYA
jgi:putative MATE family efflux protein